MLRISRERDGASVSVVIIRFVVVTMTCVNLMVVPLVLYVDNLEINFEYADLC